VFISYEFIELGDDEIYFNHKFRLREFCAEQFPAFRPQLIHNTKHSLTKGIRNWD